MRRLPSVLLLLAAAAHAVAPQLAELRVVTTPSEAVITIDGALAGLSPRTETLTPGVHTVTAELGDALTTQTLSLVAGEERVLKLTLPIALPPRAFPVAGALTFAGGALALGVGLLLQVPARHAGEQVSALYQRGGGWDDEARALEAAGLRAQTWSWILTGTGGAVMAAGLLVTGLQLFGRRADLPVLVLVPGAGGAGLCWSARW